MSIWESARVETDWACVRVRAHRVLLWALGGGLANALAVYAFVVAGGLSVYSFGALFCNARFAMAAHSALGRLPWGAIPGCVHSLLVLAYNMPESSRAPFAGRANDPLVVRRAHEWPNLLGRRKAGGGRRVACICCVYALGRLALERCEAMRRF